MITVDARAKVNLSLRVRTRDASGLHPVRSLVVTVGWRDELRVAWGEEDHLRVRGPAASGVPDGIENLVWKAVVAARRRIGSSPPLAIDLVKRIPMAAGLGGGSADAAAALVALEALTGVALLDLAGELGADVPFALRGGAALMEGYGERLTGRDLPADFVLVVASPGLRLATPEVYARWDQLGEPGGPPVGGIHLPPSLRGDAPLVNDLYPAAASLSPAVDEWRAELTARWGRPVLMSGSGPAMFGFFADTDEALGGVAALPDGIVHAAAVEPSGFGAQIVEH